MNQLQNELTDLINSQFILLHNQDMNASYKYLIGERFQYIFYYYFF